MADTTIGGIATSVTALAAADVFECEQGATTKKVTASLIQAFTSAKGANVASAGTLVLGAGEYFHITGTTTITDIDFTDTWDGRRARLVFDGSLTLTHNATTMALPGGVNIQTIAGDSCTVVVDSGDNVKITQYERAIGEENVLPNNASTAAQASITAATSTYITNSNIAIPASGFRQKTVLRWKLSCSKTNVGTASTSFFIRLGTAGTVADTAIHTFALPVGTANADVFEVFIDMVVRGPLGASCVSNATLSITKNAGTIVGIINIPTVAINTTSAGWNSTTAGLIAGISVTSGSTVVISVNHVIADSLNV